MMDAGRHPNITLLAYSEVESITGYVGNFHVKVRKKARYVKEDECTACGDCAEVCPVVVPDEFQMSLSVRKAIYIPFPQAVPSAYVVDIEHCLGDKPIACGKCIEACEKKAIDFDMQDEIVEFDVGVIIVATGMETYDPTELDEYGYTRYPDVITSLEFERLISAEGPTGGHFIRLSDGGEVKKVAFIQCVGSRSEKRGNPYCSNICCMNTIKDSLLLKEHYPDIDITVFYMDIRAFGKGFEELYKRSKELGVKYIRGLPGEVVQNNGRLKVTVENTTAGRLEEHEFDVIVLSIGAVPRGADTVGKLLTLSRSPDGFFLEAHPPLSPGDSPAKGVSLAGCAEAPKDIKDSVTQASAAAARAQILLNAGEIKIEAITAVVDETKCTGCGACVRVCPFHAIVQDGKKQPARVITAACAGCGTCAAQCPVGAITIRHFTDQQIYAQIDAALERDPYNTIVVFACNWCSYAGADTAGTARLQYPPNARVIRTMCSGRVREDFVLHAFRKGAPVVLVSGCHYADCHYINANRQTQKRVDRLWNRLEKLGIRPERLQLEWISAAEGQKWAQVMRELEELRKTVTVEEIEHTMKVLAK
ncbi:MAG: methyl-viologen-reducing hydrogenase subunit delta [Chloroflexi bacterium]|nr:MAG: methyl-viologen-reducing hydrogenase subunit delta [Chloroflexota bacterium]